MRDYLASVDPDVDHADWDVTVLPHWPPVDTGGPDIWPFRIADLRALWQTYATVGYAGVSCASHPLKQAPP